MGPQVPRKERELAMSMSLKEFTARHLKADTIEGERARWRRILPTQLRQNLQGYSGFWNKKPIYKLEEKWERIHKGDVIDTEWREVDVYYEEYYAAHFE